MTQFKDVGVIKARASDEKSIAFSFKDRGVN